MVYVAIEAGQRLSAIDSIVIHSSQGSHTACESDTNDHCRLPALDHEGGNDMTVTIQENQRGLLFKKGSFHQLLQPGSYHFLHKKDLELLSLEEELQVRHCTLPYLLQHPQIQKEISVIEVKDEQLAFHFLNDCFQECLFTGVHAFWNAHQIHRFQLIDLSQPEIAPDVSRYLLERIPAGLLIRAEVKDYEVARLYYDNTLVRLLEAGVYYFWNGRTEVVIEQVDLRKQQLELIGQEMLTRDKVTLRMNFLCDYRILDPILIRTQLKDYQQQLYTAVQLALRSQIAELRLDELLEQKERIHAAITAQLKSKEAALFVDILGTGIKDIVLPKEMRDIMNTVLTAEKTAQANVITRREEVASTRSLLNTARLMEDNPTLYKLKELEYVERIAQHVGSIHVSGQGDLLTQLTAILERKEETR